MTAVAILGAFAFAVGTAVIAVWVSAPVRQRDEARAGKRMNTMREDLALLDRLFALLATNQDDESDYVYVMRSDVRKAEDALARVAAELEQMRGANQWLRDDVAAKVETLDRLAVTMDAQTEDYKRDLDRLDSAERELVRFRETEVRLRDGLRRLLDDVALVVNDHLSGCREEREAAMPAYTRLMLVVYADEETRRDLDDAIRALLSASQDTKETA